MRILLDYLEANDDVGFAGSYIHGPDGDWHCTIFRFPTIWSEIEGGIQFGPVTRLLKKYVVPMPLPDAPTPVDWTAGASLMMRKPVLDEIGLFDETFFLYFEETDLCRRAKLAGWPTVYVPASRVTHIGSASTGMKTWKRRPAYWFDSRRHYYTKNHGSLYAGLATAAHVAARSLYRLRRMIERKAHGDPDRYLRDMMSHALGARPGGKMSHVGAPGPAGQETT